MAYSQGEVRVSQSRNLVFPHAAIEDLPAVYAALQRLDSRRPMSARSPTSSPARVSTIARSPRPFHPGGAAHLEPFPNLARQHDIGDLRSKSRAASMPAAITNVGHIGILGVDKNGVELYQISLGGRRRFRQDRVGTILGPAVTADKVVEAVDALVTNLSRGAQCGRALRRHLSADRREPFKVASMPLFRLTRRQRRASAYPRQPDEVMQLGAPRRRGI